jgi:hypothetical protein
MLVVFNRKEPIAVIGQLPALAPISAPFVH